MNIELTGGLKWGDKIYGSYVSYPFCKLILTSNSIIFKTKLLDCKGELNLGDITQINIIEYRLFNFASYEIVHNRNDLPRKLKYSCFKGAHTRLKKSFEGNNAVNTTFKTHPFL